MAARLFAVLVLARGLAWPGGEARALQAHEVLDDPALEARAREISAGLRCLVCQNQSIDDSDAQLARDLRTIVRERLVAGDSDEQVVGFVVARYGEYVLLNPPVRAQTLVLWGSPLILLAIGLLAILGLRRGQAAVAAPAPLSAEEQKRVEALLGDPPEGGAKP